MPDRSEPQWGMGFLSNSLRPLRRWFSIHSGSFFKAEMSRTTCSDIPRLASDPAVSSSLQPYSYAPIESMISSSVVGTLSVGVLINQPSFVVTAATGMVVVHTWAPPARVDRRWTWTSRMRENARVSASHHSGASLAMDCTGQWPWHNWTVYPPGPGRTDVAKPLTASA